MFKPGFPVLADLCFRFPPFGLDRQTGILPCLPASNQGAGFRPSGLSKFLRHTGAGRFVRSSAICYQPRLTREIKLGGPLGDVIRRHAHRVLSLKIRRLTAALSPHVEDN